MLTYAQHKALGQIQALIRAYYDAGESTEFVPGESVVPLMHPSYGSEEVSQAVESLLAAQITLNQSEGNKVQRFERAWSDYIGTRHGVMVNSGSSANLLALWVLSNPTTPNGIHPGDEIITPAVTWHTTISPIISVGAVPVLVDVRLEDFTIRAEDVEAHITPRTRALMPVHLLGNPCDMPALVTVARHHRLYLVEDACEAHGAHINGRRCGAFGDLATFSFFFSHHITTMEGGMLMTSNDTFAELARIMRSQGVIRNTVRRDELAQMYKRCPEYADLDDTYLFANLGFNLRPTELNGGFGLEQFKKLEGFLRCRRENGEYWIRRLRQYGAVVDLPGDTPGGRSWFAFPVVIKANAPFSRAEFRKFLMACRIETRPIMAGNVTAQPAMRHFAHRCGPLPNAQLIHTNGLFWGNHQGIGAPQREYVADCVDRFMRRYS